MKKLLVAFLAAALLAGLMVPAAFAAKKPVEVVIWDQDDPPAEAVMDKLYKEFMEKNPGIKITRVHYGTEDLRSNFQNAVIARKGPQLILAPYDNIGPFSTMGIIQPLDNLVPKSFLDGFNTSALDGNRFNGKLWGIPDRVGNHLTLVYNKKLISEAPKTMEELIAKARELTRDTNGDGKIDQYGLVYNLNEPFWFVVFQGGFGGWVMDAKNQPTLDTRATVDALQFVHDLKFKDKIVPEEADYQVADTLFKEGKAAMIINGPWSWKAYQDAKIDIGLARIPKIDSTGKWPVPMTGMKSYSVSVNVKDKELKDATLKVLMFLTGEHAQAEYLKARAIGDLPSNKKVADSAEVKNDPVLKASVDQMMAGKPMPIAPEMRAIWDAIRPSLELVMGGRMSPEDAAREMQKVAVQKIKEMKQ